MRFSITARFDAKVRAAIATIGEDTWTEIRYPQPVWDDEQQRFISRAHIAETTYTAFQGTRHEVTARLIVRRVPDLNKSTVDELGELFTVWRYHAAFTDSPYLLVQAEAQHRGHAIIEQVFAEFIDGPLAHLPSGRFNANNAWLSCIAIAHNLTRRRHPGRPAAPHRPRRHHPPAFDQRRRQDHPTRPRGHDPPARTLARQHNWLRLFTTAHTHPLDSPQQTVTRSQRRPPMTPNPAKPSSAPATRPVTPA